MSVSLTGRHHDWLSLTLCSIRSNGIQARYWRKGGAGMDGGESFCVMIGLFHLCMLVSVAREGDIYTESRQPLHSAVHLLTCCLLGLSLSHTDQILCNNSIFMYHADILQTPCPGVAPVLSQCELVRNLHIGLRQFTFKTVPGPFSKTPVSH